MQYGGDCAPAAESFQHLISNDTSSNEFDDDDDYDDDDDDDADDLPEITPPVILSVLCNRPDLTRLLLHKGADPNTLDEVAESKVRQKEEINSWENPCSLLDIVEDRLSVLNFQFTPFKAGRDYLAGLRKGSCMRWMGEGDWGIAKLATEELHRMNEAGKKQMCDPALNAEEREVHMKKLVTSFNGLRELLRSRGAKTFAELHPELLGGSREKREKRPVFELKFSFSAPDKRKFVVERYKSL
jgi:hypothetical protein